MNIINRTNNNLMFDDFIFDFFNVSNNIVPPHNIFENDTEFSVEFSVPGSDKKDFTIELENDNLRVVRKNRCFYFSNKSCFFCCASTIIC